MTSERYLEVADPRAVARLDATVGGWFDAATGQLAPGMAIGADDVVAIVGAGDADAAAFCGTRGALVLPCPPDADGRLPVEDGAASRVVCRDLPAAAARPDALLAEIARIAAPGALVLLTAPGAAQARIRAAVSLPRRRATPPRPAGTIDGEALARLATAAGLVVEGRASDGFYRALDDLFRTQFDDTRGGPHPTLGRWAKVWERTLAGPDGGRIKRALDAVLPGRSTVLARKV